MNSAPWSAILLDLDGTDVIKLIGIVAAIVVLFLLAKRLGGGGEAISAPAVPSAPEVTAAPEPQDETEALEPDQPGYIPQDDEPQDAPATTPEHIRIEFWNFAKFDLEPGPPDPSAFADELNMQLYDPSTGRRWMQSYFVANPAGLEKILVEKKWNYMFIPQILVLDRYSIPELRAAMLEELGAVEWQRGEVSPQAAE